MNFHHRQPSVLLTTWTRPADDRPRLAAPAVRATALYDAVVSALPRIEARAHERAAIVALTDGADTASDATMRDVTTALRKSDALVYAIAIDSPDPQPINTRVNAAALAELTSSTGGRVAIVRSSEELMTAAADIATELNNQYLLGYVSTHGLDGKYHSVRVRVSGGDYGRADRILTRITASTKTREICLGKTDSVLEGMRSAAADAVCAL